MNRRRDDGNAPSCKPCAQHARVQTDTKHTRPLTLDPLLPHSEVRSRPRRARPPRFDHTTEPQKAGPLSTSSFALSLRGVHATLLPIRPARRAQAHPHPPFARARLSKAPRRQAKPHQKWWPRARRPAPPPMLCRRRRQSAAAPNAHPKPTSTSPPLLPQECCPHATPKAMPPPRADSTHLHRQTLCRSSRPRSP